MNSFKIKETRKQRAKLTAPKFGSPAWIVQQEKEERIGKGQYWTPPHIVEALLKCEPEWPGPIWEPCAGNGAIVKVLKAHGHEVLTSDKYRQPDFKCDFYNDFLDNPESGVRNLPMDLDDPDDPVLGYKSIITNPPYYRLYQWAKNLITWHNPEKAAMLLPAMSFTNIAHFLMKRDMSLAQIIMFDRPVVFVGPSGTARPNFDAVCWFILKRGQHRGKIRTMKG